MDNFHLGNVLPDSIIFYNDGHRVEDSNEEDRGTVFCQEIGDGVSRKQECETDMYQENSDDEE